MPRFFVKSCDSDSDSEDEFSDEDSAKLNIFRFSDDEEEADNCVVNKREKNVRFEPEHEVTNLTARWQRDADNKVKVAGTKHTERLEKLEQLAEGNDLGVGMRVKMKYSIISALFDCQMERVVWNELLERTSDILRILNSHVNVIVNERIVIERLNKVEVGAEIPLRRFYLIHGCMLTVVEQLDVEFYKMLEETDVHSLEYAKLLEDETRICQIIDSLQSYVERLNFPSELCRLYLRKMEHLYYRIDPDYIGLRQVETLRLMDRFSNFICSNEKRESICIRALLYQVYHLALHDKWNEAVAVMEQFRLQDKVNRSGQHIKVLFNKTLVQLGLCAFRNGHMEEAHELLYQFHTRPQAEKLLGQNLRTRNSKQYPFMEQTPRHLHVDLTVLKCVYLVSAMLIEVPDMVADQTLSPNFEDFIHTELVPYSAVEHIIAASRALSNGLWLDCCSYIINSRMNVMVWNSFPQAGKIRSMLVRKIKEQSLRTYLLTYSSKYDSLSLETLTQMFKLPQAQVQSIISEMIDGGEIDAFVDQVTQSVVMCRASQFSDLRLVALSKAVDHGLLSLLQDDFMETCSKFHVENPEQFQQSLTQWDHFTGMLDQLARVAARKGPCDEN